MSRSMDGLPNSLGKWPREWLATAGVGLVGGIVAFILSLIHWPVPTVHDEFSHLLVADTLLEGRLSNPTPPVWPVFQSEHVVVTPTYASKYPLGPGALLALGQVLTGLPHAGLWIGAGLASASVVWLVRSITTLRIAIWAGLMVALHPNLQSIWSQTFMNGWLALTSASLVVGSAIRLRRAWTGSVAAVFVCGALGLGLTRPMEGLFCVAFASLFFLPRAVFAFREWWQGFSPIQCSWVLIPAVGGMSLLLAHHHAVTGRFTQMPYQLHEQQYGVAPLWIFQKPQTPSWLHDHSASDQTKTESNVKFISHTNPMMADRADNETTVSRFSLTSKEVPREIRAYHTDWSMDSYRKRASLSGWFSGCFERLRVSFEYFGLITILATVGLSKAWKWTKVQVTTLAVFGLLGISTFVPWIFPHYYSPMLPWLIVLSVIAIRHAPITMGEKLPGKTSARPLMASLLILQILLLLIEGYDLAYFSIPKWPHKRQAIENELLASEGKHLVLVRYSDLHNIHDEWVYNPADFDSARVLWARSWDSDYDSQLLDHFGDTHHIWVIEPDAEEVELKKFSKLSAQVP